MNDARKWESCITGHQRECFRDSPRLALNQRVDKSGIGHSSSRTGGPRFVFVLCEYNTWMTMCEMTRTVSEDERAFTRRGTLSPAVKSLGATPGK